jgi:hypothetical protein
MASKHPTYLQNTLHSYGGRKKKTLQSALDEEIALTK